MSLFVQDFPQNTFLEFHAKEMTQKNDKKTPPQNTVRHQSLLFFDDLLRNLKVKIGNFADAGV